MAAAEINENDIAIVGMAVRVPGARNTDEFWRNLRDGVCSIETWNEEELRAAGESPEALRHPNYVKAGAPLPDMEMFDGEFFGFSPKESAILDPQHRHFFECAWEALENAGHPPDKLEGSTAVYAGCGMGSYFYFNLCSHPDLLRDVGTFLLRHTGNDKDFLSTRLSYLLDLKGPSVNVQTACSTSLVAVHQAVQALLSRECDLAIAGGVTIELPHRRGYIYKEGEVLSPDGQCHAFDHRAQGTVFGSGVGVVVLRRLVDAVEDGDHIHAVIKATAINNDGASKVGYLAPSVEGQAACMLQAHALADIPADTISYVETHGTGTYLGDPIEVAALTEAFRRSTDKKGFCRIGSVKTNIGHLDTAAGVVSLIKTTLALENRQMPPSLGFEKPNPTIDFANSPFVVNAELTDWSAGATPRRAAVNSLGVGGTNAHIVLEEASARAASATAKRPHQLLAFSAKARKALDDYGKKLGQHLRDHAEQPLADVAWTLLNGRKPFERRRVIVAASHAEAAERLETHDPQRVFTHTVLEDPSVVFLFPGGAAQYAGMARGLYASEPVFREVIDRGLAYLHGKLDVDLRALLLTEPDLEKASKLLERSTLQLPAIFLVDVALARLLISKGIEPAAMLGHSLGEYAAAHLADVFSLEEGLELVKLRGQLLGQVAKGAMLSVPLAEEELRGILPAELDLAADNAPGLCSVSGTEEAVKAFEAELQRRGLEARRAPIDIAAHSRHLDPVLPRFRQFLETLKLRAPQRPYVSCLTGTWIESTQATSPAYWVDHFRQTVRFTDAVGTLAEEQNRIFIEVGPGKTLGSLAKQHPKVDVQTVLATLRHRDERIDDQAFLVEVLGRAWALGAELDLDALLWKGEKRQRVPLPTYAFQHQRYFIEPRAHQPAAAEVELRRSGSLEEWGWAPVWKQIGVDGEATDETHRWLVFLDDTGLGDKLVQRLRDRGHPVTVVRPGDTYAKQGDHEYLLAPERGREGYDALVRDLVKSANVPTRILHAWLVTADESFRPGSSFLHRNQERGFYSLFFLAQALADENVPRPLGMFVLSSGMQRLGDELLPYPEKAMVLGPAKVLPRELPGVTCTVIDVQLPSPSNRLFPGGLRRALVDPFAGRKAVSDGYDLLAESLEEELRAPPQNAVAAYRRGKRFALHHVRKPLAASAEVVPRLRDRGVYLVTGGMGGIGLVVAEQLARKARARLVLVGRRSLPPREDWSAWCGAHPAEDETSRRIRQVQSLEALGAEVMVASADVTNLDDMTRVVGEARSRFGKIHGVVHAAGVVADAPLQAKTLAQVEEVFAPKVHGTEILDALFPPAELDFLVLFSSTSTVLAAPGQVDYVAANEFLNAFAHSRAARGDKGAIALQWGVWSEVGMAASSIGGTGGGAPKLTFEKAGQHFFELLGRESDGTAVLAGPLHPRTHWLLDDHRTAEGHALVPGTGYLEFAAEALRALNEQRAFEIKDLLFIRPLAVADEEGPREMRARLRRSEQGYGFELRSECTVDGRRAWQLHAQAQLSLLAQPAAGTV
ncbi:MAG: type I polyketide synthase, partial [Myxococcaceae bacterium]